MTPSVRGEAKDYPSAPEADELAPGELRLEDALGILRRRKWLILSTACLGAMIGLLIGLQRVPQYTAKALLLIDPRASKVVDFDAVMRGIDADSTSVETEIRVLESRSHLEQVVTSLGLERDPAYQPPPDRPTTVVLTVGEPWQRLVGWLPESWLIATGLADEPLPSLLMSEDGTFGPAVVAAPGRAVLDGSAIGRSPAATGMAPADTGATLATVIATERAIETLQGGFKVAQEGRSRVLTISFTSPDPDRAARIANKSVELYLEEQLEQKRQATGKATSWLSERLVSLKGEVERAEAAVQEYRITHRLSSAGRTDITDQQIADINRELVNAAAEAAGRQARLGFIRDLRRRGQSVDSLPEVMGSPLILSLRQQETELLRIQAELASSYGERHPRIQLLHAEQQKLEGKINQEIDRIVANLENEAKILNVRVASLQANLDKAQAKSGAAQSAEVRLGELEREATASRQLYENLLQRYKETSEQQQLVEPDGRMLAPAVAPPKPSTLGYPLFALIGFTISTMLGGIMAFFLERLDKGLRSERDIHDALGMPRLSLVPQLGGLGRSRPHQYLLKRPFSAYTEAMRAILTALRLAGSAEAQPRLLLVTSSVPAEGKTTLAVSLATYAAFAGQRVLLIDLDLRRPSVLRELGPGLGMAQGQTRNGIVEHLLGEIPLEEAIQHVPDLKLDFLSASNGSSTDPLPLLASPRMAQLMRRVKESYDWVVIDSPPLLGVTDAQQLARLVDKVLFVVRWGHTKRVLARNAIGILQDIRADIAGAVVTQVDIKRHAQYSYGDVGDYYSKYQKYYVN